MNGRHLYQKFLAAAALTLTVCASTALAQNGKTTTTAATRRIVRSYFYSRPVQQNRGSFTPRVRGK